MVRHSNTISNSKEGAGEGCYSNLEGGWAWVGIFMFSQVFIWPVDCIIALGQSGKRYVLWKSYVVCLLCSSKVDQMQDIVTGNPAVIRMVVHFNR